MIPMQERECAQASRQHHHLLKNCHARAKSSMLYALEQDLRKIDRAANDRVEWIFSLIRIFNDVREHN